MARLSSIKHDAYARKVAAEIIKPSPGKSPTQIYTETYGPHPSNQTSSNTLLARQDVASRIRYLIAQATPPDFLSKQLKQLSKARKGIYFKGILKATEPDNGIRLEAVRTILKVCGVHTEQEGMQDNRSINFQINVSDAQELGAIAAELKQLNEEMLGAGASSSEPTE